MMYGHGTEFEVKVLGEYLPEEYRLNMFEEGVLKRWWSSNSLNDITFLEAALKCLLEVRRRVESTREDATRLVLLHEFKKVWPDDRIS